MRHVLIFAVLVFGLFGLQSCGKKSDTAADRDVVVKSPVSDDVSPLESVLEPDHNAQLLVSANDQTIGSFKTAALLRLKTAENGAALRATGHREESSSTGKIQGIVTELDTDWSKKAAGRTVRVSALVKSAGDSPQPFHIAYSTGEFGNSGWKELEAKNDYSVVSFRYDIKAHDASNPDYVGFLPDPDNDGVGIVVRSIGVTVLKDRP